MSARLVLVLLVAAMALPVKATPAHDKQPLDGPACAAVFRLAESRYSDARNADLTIIVAKASDDLATAKAAHDPQPARPDNTAFRECARRYIANKADQAALLNHPPF